MSKHARTAAEVEFRKFSAERLRHIYTSMNTWYAEWIDGEHDAAVLGRDYPFDRALLDLSLEVLSAAQRLDDTDPDSHEPRHRMPGRWFGERFAPSELGKDRQPEEEAPWD